MPDKSDRILGLDLVLGLKTSRRWHIRLAHRAIIYETKINSISAYTPY